MVFNRTLSVQPLPVALFSNGHIAWVQRTPWRSVPTVHPAALPAALCSTPCARVSALARFPLPSSMCVSGCRQGIVPMAVHATFVKGGTAGKIARFR